MLFAIQTHTKRMVELYKITDLKSAHNRFTNQNSECKYCRTLIIQNMSPTFKETIKLIGKNRAGIH